jgi:hypothetical protein
LSSLDLYLKNREPVSKISVLELKALLVLISDHVHSIRFRYRLMGQMWQLNYMRVIHVSEKGVFLKDEIENKMISIPHLKMIIQFELDGSVQAFEPNFHYDVIPNDR